MIRSVEHDFASIPQGDRVRLSFTTRPTETAMRLGSRCLLLLLSPMLPLTAHAADAGVNTKLTTPAYDASAKFRAVHIDTLDPHLQSIFEGARIEWLKVLTAHHTTDG